MRERIKLYNKSSFTTAELAKRTAGVALLATVFLMAAARRKSSSSDISLAIINGVVWTADSTNPWAEAVAISADRVVAVGSTSEIRDRVSPQTRVIDARGEMVAPGFIDSHVHFLAGGLNLPSVQPRDARTPAGFIPRIKEVAATRPARNWITRGPPGHQN